MAAIILTPELIEARRRGGLNRAKQFTHEYQQMTRARCSSDVCAANGRRGGIAYVKKYGKQLLVERARQWRIEHPSELQLIVEEALALSGFTRDSEWERDARIFPKSRRQLITGDCVFRKRKAVIYADGAAWHSAKAMPDTPSFANCIERGTKDEHYDNYLRYKGWTVLRLSEAEIKAFRRGDGGAMLDRIRTFLNEETA